MREFFLKRYEKYFARTKHEELSYEKFQDLKNYAWVEFEALFSPKADDLMYLFKDYLGIIVSHYKERKDKNIKPIKDVLSKELENEPKED